MAQMKGTGYGSRIQGPGFDPLNITCFLTGSMTLVALNTAKYVPQQEQKINMKNKADMTTNVGKIIWNGNENLKSLQNDFTEL